MVAWGVHAGSPRLLYAGWRGSSIPAAATLSIAAYLPWVAALSACAAITGRPVGHDVWVSDAVFWIGVAVQFAFWLCVTALGLGVRWCAHRFVLAA